MEIVYGSTGLSIIRQCIISHTEMTLTVPPSIEVASDIPCTQIALGAVAWFCVTFTSDTYIYEFDSKFGWRYSRPHVPLTPQYISSDQGVDNVNKLMSVDDTGILVPTPISHYVEANPTLSGNEDTLTGLKVDGSAYRVTSGGSGGSSDYNDLTNRPSINGVTLSGNKTSSELKLDQTFVFEQRVASDEWDIVHNLNKYPSITVVDSAGTIVVGDMQYVTDNSVKIRFCGAFSGKAYLN